MTRLAGSRRVRWAALALLCIVAGAVGSLLGARAVAHNDADKSRSTFQLASNGIVSSLELAMQRQNGLTLGASTFFAAHPKATHAEFEQWALWAGGDSHYAGLGRLALVALLPREQAASAAATTTGQASRAAATTTTTQQSPSAASATTGQAPSGTVATTQQSPSAATATTTQQSSLSAGATVASATAAQQSSLGPSATAASGATTESPHPTQTAVPGARVVSVDGRSFECFTVGELPHHANGRAAAAASRRDCSLTPTLLLTRDAGRSRYRSMTVQGAPALALDTPVYRGNALPVSAVGRSAAFVGWLRQVLLPQKLMQQALHGHPAQALRLSYSAGPSTLPFALGVPQPGAQATTADLHGGWTAQVLGSPVDAGVLSNGDSLALLIMGCLAALLAGALVFVIGSGGIGGAFGSGVGGVLGLGGEEDGPPTASTPAPEPVPQPSLYDPLTGLPGRELTLDRAACMLARVGRQSGMLTGALLIDVDWFKDINDKLGSSAGDQLLQVVAERLQRVVRADDTVGRLDDDRFVALVESRARGVKLESLASRMIDSLHEPVEIEGFGPSFHMTASIGVAFGRYARTEDLLADTQVALDAAKAAGKDRFTLFNANLRSVIEDRGVLDSELNAALQDKQFFLLYQPIYDLATRRVVGMEAHINWLHPERGVVPAADFIAAAEETALIVPIGRWALEEACTRAAAWAALGHRVGVAVKVSPAQLGRDGFGSDVRRALQQSGIEPAALTLEIPEAAVIADVAMAAERLAEVKQLGVRIAIEDFGGGYAYRSDLQRLPLDYLRVDRSSVASADDEDYRSWLLEAIVLFARDLSLGVIVTEVQTSEQLANLERIGCTMVQGPLPGDPVPLEAVEGVLGKELVVAPAPASMREPGVASMAEPATAPVGASASSVAGSPAGVAPVETSVSPIAGSSAVTDVQTPASRSALAPASARQEPLPSASPGQLPSASPEQLPSASSEPVPAASSERLSSVPMEPPPASGPAGAPDQAPTAASGGTGEQDPSPEASEPVIRINRPPNSPE